MSDKQLILETVKNLIGLKARNVKLWRDCAFLTIGFGNDIEYTKTLEKSETKSRPEWYLWTQSSEWEIHLNETGVDILCSSRDERTTIAEKISLLEGMVLQEIKIDPSLSSTKFMFGDYGPSLMVHTPEWWFSDLLKGDALNWKLFTPEKKVLCVQRLHAWIAKESGL